MGSCDFTVCSQFSDICTDEFYLGINYDTTIALIGILSRWSFLATLHYSVWKYSYEGVPLSSHASCNIRPVSIQFNIIAVRLRLYVQWERQVPFPYFFLPPLILRFVHRFKKKDSNIGIDGTRGASRHVFVYVICVWFLWNKVEKNNELCIFF